MDFMVPYNSSNIFLFHFFTGKKSTLVQAKADLMRVNETIGWNVGRCGNLTSSTASVCQRYFHVCS